MYGNFVCTYYINGSKTKTKISDDNVYTLLNKKNFFRIFVLSVNDEWGIKYIH